MFSKQSQINAFLLSVIRKVESLREGVICIAYSERYEGNPNCYYWVAVDDFDFYSKDEKLKTLSKQYQTIASKNGVKMAVCYQSMTETSLLKLANENDLLMNIY